MVSTKKQKRTRNATRRVAHNALRPENALRFFKTLSPVLTKFLKKHPELQYAVDYYKGMGYSAMNRLLNFKKYEMESFGTQIYVSKHQVSDKSPLKPLYETAYEQFEADPTNIVKAMKASVLNTIIQITALQQAFKLFKPPANYVLPILYRGISVADPAKQPFHGAVVGQSVTMSGFQSCSLSIETAIGFQSCSSNGPCCLFVMQVDPAVKFLPLFWGTTESYSSSEHEVVLEPYTQFVLDAVQTERLPINVARKCNYNKFNADGTISIDVYYITVKPPGADASAAFDALVNAAKNNLDDAIVGMKLAVDFSQSDFV